MACNIQYTEVKLIGNTLIVRGTAESCSGVVVDLEDVVVTNPKNATFIQPGVWEVILTATDIANPAITNFDGLRIKCGENINLHAVCVDDENCTGAANFMLTCEDCIQYTEVKLVGNTLTIRGTAELCSEVIVVLEDEVVTNPKNATVNEEGEWNVIFTATDLADPAITNFDGLRIKCGENIKLRAVCVDDENCTGPASFILTCEDEVGCPSVTVTVRPGDCNENNTKREMIFTVTVEGGGEIDYRWDFGVDEESLTDIFTGPGSFDNPNNRHYYAAGTYSAHLVIVDPPGGCLATPDPISFVVEPCVPAACPDNPRFIAERHLPGGQLHTEDLEAQCIPPGEYTISLSNEFPSDTVLYWEVNDEPAGSESEILVTVGPGETVKVEVTATKTGCPPKPESEDLVGCVDECPEAELVLERPLSNGTREFVPVDRGCIAAGNYIVRLLLDPPGDFPTEWHRNGVPVEGEHGPTLEIRLEEGQRLAVTAVVTIPGTCVLNPPISFEACECTDNLSLAVFDENGDPIDPSQCVVPGTYTVRASGSGLGDENTERTWRINDRDVAGDGTERDVQIAAPVTASCSEDAPSTTVSIKVSTPGCDSPKEATVTLRACEEYVFSICCQLIGTLVLLLAGLTVVAAALAFCPAVLVVPPLVAFFVAFGFPIVIGLLFLLIIAIIIWFAICKPDWCRDILPKLWQLALMAGIVFIYFGSCPLCNVTLIGSLFVWGVLLLLAGAGLLLWWILGDCRPTRCLVAWRLIELGIVSTIIGAIETILGLLPAVFGLPACVSLGAVVFLWLINAFLDGLVLLLPLFCSFNPAAPSAFAFFRRSQILSRL